MPPRVTVRKLHAVRPESEFQLYESRWGQLGIMSVLALVSDWVCFATAAVPREFKQATGHESAQLIDLFLTFNVLSCFLYTDVSKKLGLRDSTVMASAIMAAGCLLRNGFFHEGLPSYEALAVGTALVGVAQPFFQCAPPLLSATWFASSERSLATATALNANQLGIAAAFVVGGSVVAGHPDHMKSYLDLIAAASCGICALTVAFFKERPPTPPTASAASAEKSDINYYQALVILLTESPGFVAALAAFVASIGVTNVVSAFAGDALQRADCPAPISAVGAAFQVAIVLGGVALGALVDRTRAYKTATLACLATALGLVVVLGIACGYDSNMPARVVVAVILALGAAIGPVQPVAAELAVEVTHPLDENAVEATQQLAGNLFSALLVPLYQAAQSFDLEVEPASFAHHFGFTDHLHNHRGLLLPEPAFLGNVPRDMRGDTLLLVLLVGITFTFFSQARFHLKRSEFDNQDDDNSDTPGSSSLRRQDDNDDGLIALWQPSLLADNATVF